MTDYVDGWPTARRRHRCGVCCRSILPGEAYWRQAGLDRSGAWTNKTCEHCERAVWAYGRDRCEDEWDPEWVAQWLEDNHPSAHASMLAGWRWPDGELTPVPFGSRCFSCGCRVEFRHLWCGPCDDARVERLHAEFAAVQQAIAAAVRQAFAGM